MRRKDFLKKLHKEMKYVARVSRVDLDLLRPFTCSGNPLKCEVILVGINPATPIKGLFKKCWNKKKLSFDKTKFNAVYAEARGGEAPSEKSYRHKIGVLVGKLKRSSRSVLETNLWPIPTAARNQLTPEHEMAGMGCLRLLLKANTHWRLIVAMGVDAGMRFELSPPNEVLFCDHPTHVGGNWDSKKIASEIRKRFRKGKIRRPGA